MRLSLESLGELRPDAGGAASRPAQPDDAAIDFGAVLQLLAADVPAMAAPSLDVAAPGTDAPADEVEGIETSPLILNADAKSASLELLTPGFAPLMPPLAKTTSPVPEIAAVERSGDAPATGDATVIASQVAAMQAIAMPTIAPQTMSPATIESQSAASVDETDLPNATPTPTSDAMSQAVASTDATLAQSPTPANDVPAQTVAPVSTPISAAAVPQSEAPASPLRSEHRMASDAAAAVVPAALDAIADVSAVTVADEADANATRAEVTLDVAKAIPTVAAAAEQASERPSVRPRSDARPALTDADGKSAITKFDRVAQAAVAESLEQPRAIQRVVDAPVHRGAEPAAPAAVHAVRAEAASAAQLADDGAPASLLRSQLIETMRMQMRDGGGQAELRLNPEFLGSLRVSIVVDHGSVKATLLTETPAALEHVQRSVEGLREALAERGLRLDEFDIAEDPSAGHYQANEGRQPSQQRGGEPRKPHHPAARPAPRGDGFAEAFDVVA